MRANHPLTLGITRRVWIAGFALGLIAPHAAAQSTTSSTAAQALFDQGKALMAAGKAAEACPKLEESQRLDPGSGTLLNLALCYEQTGRLASAWTMYRDAAAAAKAAGNFERERGARKRAATLEPKIAKVLVEVPAEARVSGLTITRDGVVVGDAQWGLAVPADEGTHVFTAKAPGHEDWHTSVEVVGAGATVKVTVPALTEAAVTPAPASVPAAAPPIVSTPVVPHDDERKPAPGLGSQRIAALAVGGAGVVGVVVGSIFGFQTISKKQEADKSCNGSVCQTDDGVTAGNDAHKAGTISTVSMILGGAALAGGLALWFTAPKSPKTEVLVTSRGLFLRRAF